jgi:TonB family protein
MAMPASLKFAMGDGVGSSRAKLRVVASPVDPPATVDGGALAELRVRVSVEPSAMTRRPEYVRLAASVAVALVAHGALLWAFVPRYNDDVGGGGSEIDAISVTLVEGAAQESRNTAATRAGATSEASVEQHDGSHAEQPPPRPSEAAESQRTDAEPPARLPEIAAAIAPPPERPIERETEKPRVRDEPKPVAKPSPAQAHGGASARSTYAIKQTGEAAAAASPGQIAAYARSVAEVLARGKPKGIGIVGSARVGFVIGTAGRVETTRLLESSGNERLDTLALAAIRAAVFSPPPPGTAARQRTFQIAYHFK